MKRKRREKDLKIHLTLFFLYKNTFKEYPVIKNEIYFIQINKTKFTQLIFVASNAMQSRIFVSLFRCK